MTDELKILERLFYYPGPLDINYGAVFGISYDNMKNCLTSLHKRNIVRIAGNVNSGVCSLTDTGRNYCITTLGFGPIEELNQKTDVIDVAIDDLKQRLSGKEVKDLNLKLKVLKKLADLFEDSLSDVLKEIAVDLKGV